jgi:uncharacterized membrane protein YcjF (UPF0283 family)
MEPTDPPRKHYGLKARQFEHLNAPDKAPEKSTEHDIFAMLEQNRSVERQSGKDEIEIKPKRKSRRKRDYWQVLIGGNLLIFGIVAIARFNLISLLFGFSGVIILTLSLTWVMWFVLDDY